MTSIEEFMKIATNEQRNVLFELSDLAKREDELSKKINAIHDSVKNGVFMENGAIALCEDEDDAMVISIGPTMELKRIREQMKKCMRKAVQLGIGHLGLIQRNYTSYTGETLPSTS